MCMCVCLASGEYWQCLAEAILVLRAIHRSSLQYQSLILRDNMCHIYSWCRQFQCIHFIHRLFQWFWIQPECQWHCYHNMWQSGISHLQLKVNYIIHILIAELHWLWWVMKFDYRRYCMFVVCLLIFLTMDIFVTCLQTNSYCYFSLHNVTFSSCSGCITFDILHIVFILYHAYKFSQRPTSS